QFEHNECIAISETPHWFLEIHSPGQHGKLRPPTLNAHRNHEPGTPKLCCICNKVWETISARFMERQLTSVSNGGGFASSRRKLHFIKSSINRCCLLLYAALPFAFPAFC